MRDKIFPLDETGLLDVPVPIKMCCWAKKIDFGCNGVVVRTVKNLIPPGQLRP